MSQRLLLCVVVMAVATTLFRADAEIDDFEGYQGFVDAGYTFAAGEYGQNSISVLTSHGIQIVPTYLYTGIGTGLQYYHDVQACAVPMFADFRSCLLPDENVSPFVDLKIGYVAVFGNNKEISDGGLFFRPMIGCTFVVKDFVALNAGIGYSFENVRIPSVNLRKNIGGFCVNFGVQF